METRPLKIIRLNCFDCQGWDGFEAKPIKRVKGCHTTSCRFYPFRFGTNPYHPMSRSKRSLDNLKKYKGE